MKTGLEHVWMLPSVSDCTRVLCPHCVFPVACPSAAAAACSYMDLREMSQKLSCTRRNVMTRDKFSCQ
jgi:hypothetical protein